MRTTRINPAHKFVPRFLQTLIWLPTRFSFVFFGKFEIHGKKNLKNISQAIFAVNHTSELDPIILTAALSPLGKFAPMFYVVAPAKEFDRPELRWRKHVYTSTFFKAWGAHETVRGLRDYNKSLETHVKLLRKGNSLCVFPEGGITKSGEPRDPHGGFIHLARESGIPIVPVAITGVYKISPKTFFGRKRRIVLEFGKPIFEHQISATAVEEYKDEATRIFSHIKKILAKYKKSTS